MKFRVKLYVRSKSTPIEFDCFDFYEAFSMVCFQAENSPQRVYRVPLSEVLWIDATEIKA